MRTSLWMSRNVAGPCECAAAGAPGVFGDRELVVEMQPPLLELAEHDLGGHQLGGRGRNHRLVGVLLEQHRAALEIDEQGEGRGGLKALRARRRGRQDRIPATSRTTPGRSGEQTRPILVGAAKETPRAPCSCIAFEDKSTIARGFAAALSIVLERARGSRRFARLDQPRERIMPQEARRRRPRSARNRGRGRRPGPAGRAVAAERPAPRRPGRSRAAIAPRSNGRGGGGGAFNNLGFGAEAATAGSGALAAPIRRPVRAPEPAAARRA